MNKTSVTKKASPATRVLCGIIVELVCVALSVIPVLVGRGYVGYRVDEHGLPADLALVEFWPALRLKYLVPLVYVGAIIAYMGVGPFLREASAGLVGLAGIGIIAVSLSFLLPDDRPPGTKPGG